MNAGHASSLAAAQLQVARSYGFPNWTKLKNYVESFEEVGQLKAAIDVNDVDRVVSLMTRNPALHRAALGYRKNGPLTWVAECRVPWQPPTHERLRMAEWMLDHGSDVHQGGDGPLMRAALLDDRIPADAAARQSRRRRERVMVATYSRSSRLAECVDVLRATGAHTRYHCPAVLDVMCGHVDDFSHRLDEDPGLVHRRFRDLDFGATATRRLSLAGGTLLHVAAEYGVADAAALLLDRGADVNALADNGDPGGGQPPIFHAVAQFDDYGYAPSRNFSFDVAPT